MRVHTHAIVQRDMDMYIQVGLHLHVYSTYLTANRTRFERNSIFGVKSFISWTYNIILLLFYFVCITLLRFTVQLYLILSGILFTCM